MIDRLVTALRYCFYKNLISSTAINRMLERLVVWEKTFYKQTFFSVTVERAITDRWKEDHRRHIPTPARFHFRNFFMEALIYTHH